MLTQPDFFGHWGYAFIALGMLYLSFNDRVGWLFRFFGEALWVVVGFWTGMTSIWMWGLLFLVLDWNGYRSWKKQDETPAEPLNDFWSEDFSPDCDGEKHQPYCRDYVPDDEGYWMAAGDPVELPVAKKRKTNGKGKAKRNSAPKRKSERARVATKRRSASNRKSKPRRG